MESPFSNSVCSFYYLIYTIAVPIFFSYSIFILILFCYVKREIGKIKKQIQDHYLSLPKEEELKTIPIVVSQDVSLPHLVETTIESTNGKEQDDPKEPLVVSPV